MKKSPWILISASLLQTRDYFCLFSLPTESETAAGWKREQEREAPQRLFLILNKVNLDFSFSLVGQAGETSVHRELAPSIDIINKLLLLLLESALLNSIL
jgi:hypothetical protein